MEGDTVGRSLGGALKAAQAVSGVQVACAWSRLLYGTAGTSRLDTKGVVHVATPQAPEYRCEALGRSRSSS